VKTFVIFLFISVKHRENRREKVKEVYDDHHISNRDREREKEREKERERQRRKVLEEKESVEVKRREKSQRER
jgi:hypothetical protein